MAINTKFAQKSFTGLPNWAKGIIAVTLVSVTVYALYKLKKVVSGDNESDNKEGRDVLNELEKESKKKQASYAPSQYKTFANTIETAGFDIGTDEAAIYSTFRKLKNNTDYLMFLNAWGQPNRKVYEWGIGRNMTLPQFLRYEMSDSEIRKINEILASKGITYRV